MADLVTIEQVRAHLNLDDDTSHDTELNLYIDAVTQHVEDRYGTVDTAPADLKLAALEDIRGLYQPGQIMSGPAAFNPFGGDTDIRPDFRPLRLWPRVDAWLDRASRGSRQPIYSFPDAPSWPDAVEWP